MPWPAWIQILCLDEFSADLDVVEREHILNYLKEESETKRVTVLYATHIFDNLGDWPTHLLRMSKGRVLEMITLADHKKSMQATAYDWIMADSPSQVCNEAKFKYPAAPLQVCALWPMLLMPRVLCHPHP